MSDIENILDQIIGILEPFGIDKLILFGSYAYGSPGLDSDIDLLVVTDDEFTPENFTEKAQLNIVISRLLDGIKAKVPLDLIVHTRAMHKNFLKMNGMFCREIANKGKVLYERY
jgi:predicted nucleotidyltransferase